MNSDLLTEEDVKDGNRVIRGGRCGKKGKKTTFDPSLLIGRRESNINCKFHWQAGKESS